MTPDLSCDYQWEGEEEGEDNKWDGKNQIKKVRCTRHIIVVADGALGSVPTTCVSQWDLIRELCRIV